MMNILNDRKNNKLQIIVFFLIITSIIIPNNAFSVTELSGNFGLKKRVYGTDRENDIVTHSYSGSIATYFFNLTALEVNFSQNEDTTTERTRIQYNDVGLAIVGSERVVLSRVYGIGLRQALAPHKSRFVPSLSLGYAKQLITYNRNTTYELISSGKRVVKKENTQKSRSNSVFASFALKMIVVGGFSLKGSVKTVFPAFEYDKARDHIQYLVGFSWIF